MANPIAYNSGTTVSGCINTGTISLAIDNLNYSARPGNLNWYAGADPTNRYLIVSDTYSQGVDTQANSKPTIWATSALTDNELLKWINGLPARSGQSTFGTLSDAISWLTSQNKYLISNQHYPQIVTSGMVLNLDAGFTSSYPNVGTSWYDLYSGKTTTLTNGPSWTNNGISSYFTFDGSDDYAVATSIPIITAVTVDTVFRFVNTATDSSNYRYVFSLGVNEPNRMISLSKAINSPSIAPGLVPNQTYIYLGGGGDSELRGVNYIMTGSSYLHGTVQVTNSGTIKCFINGVEYLVTGGTKSLPFYSSGSILNIGRWMGQNSWYLNGNVAKLKIYNRELNQTEILQNYYQGRLVTSGLTFAIDAGNLVSYSGGGNKVYALVSSGSTDNTANLINGPTWTYLSGGTFSFDGTDDYCQATNLPISGNTAFTLSCFTNVQANPTSGSGDGGIMLYGKMGIANQVGGIYYRASDNYVRFTAWGGTGVDYSTGFLKDFNVWHHWVLVYNGTNVLVYRDGIPDPNGSQIRSLNITESTLTIGAAPQNSSYLQQKIPMVQLYNRALSESEIKQNFEAYRGRFGV